MTLKEKINAANEEALRRIVAANPVLVDVAPASEVVPGMRDKLILHSGPPVTWERMCGAQRGAAIGMCLFEGWAKDAASAERMLAQGEIAFEPNHHHATVGPMAGTITKNMWVWVVQNKAFGNRAQCRQVESFQQFGDYSKEALSGLQKWRDIWAPTLRAAVRKMDGVMLKPLIARALQMGDEMHNRVVASSSIFANAIAPILVDCGRSKEDVVATLYYIGNHPFLFLGLAMAAGKAAMDPARGIEASTVVTAMARNGTEFGIQVSGLDGEWFTAPSPRVKGLFLPGWKDADAGADMGDSAITETVGWGGAVIGGAPGILTFTGGTAEEALGFSREMRNISVGRSPDYLIPALNFEGAAVGIDIRKVMQTNTVPVIDTAIAHKEPGHSIIGGGIVRPPLECFKKALTRFGEKYKE
ncbi:MAG: DUF1116 domain-containing protein [Betaproteobacteria bacterium]|nr:DUF1116 domain-containing protein [Betaproteobacteria bacterium]MBV9362415.1 DUF1116 domain-containing protein [Betaproteobacteria bacterium]